MLNRPHDLLMPFLGAIADQPVHPLHKDSTDVLETLFGEPPQGTPWSVWVKNSSSQEGNKNKLPADVLFKTRDFKNGVSCYFQHQKIF